MTHLKTWFQLPSALSYRRVTSQQSQGYSKHTKTKIISELVYIVIIINNILIVTHSPYPFYHKQAIKTIRFILINVFLLFDHHNYHLHHHPNQQHHPYQQFNIRIKTRIISVSNLLFIIMPLTTLKNPSPHYYQQQHYKYKHIIIYHVIRGYLV